MATSLSTSQSTLAAATPRQKSHQKRLGAIEKIRTYEAQRKVKDQEKKRVLETRYKVMEDQLAEGEDLVTKIVKVFKEVKTFQSTVAKFYGGLSLKDTEEKKGLSNGSPLVGAYWKRIAQDYENYEKMLGASYDRLKKQKELISDLRKEASSQKSKVLKQFTEQSSKHEKTFAHFEKVASTYQLETSTGQAEDIYLVAMEYQDAAIKTQETHLACYQSTVTLFEKAEKMDEQRVLTLKSIFEEYLAMQSKHYVDLAQIGEATLNQMRGNVQVYDPKSKGQQQQQQQQQQYDQNELNKEREMFDVIKNALEFPFHNEKKKEGELSKEGGLIMKSFSRKRVMLTKAGFLHVYEPDEKDKEKEPSKTLFVSNFNMERGKDGLITFTHVDPKNKDKHLFKAASDPEADQWVEAFNKRKAKLSGSAPAK